MFSSFCYFDVCWTFSIGLAQSHVDHEHNWFHSENLLRFKKIKKRLLTATINPIVFHSQALDVQLHWFVYLPHLDWLPIWKRWHQMHARLDCPDPLIPDAPWSIASRMLEKSQWNGFLTTTTLIKTNISNNCAQQKPNHSFVVYTKKKIQK